MKVCRKCGTKLVIKDSKRTAQQLTKLYYFTSYFFCPHCHTIYHDEQFKVINQNSDLFSSHQTLIAKPVEVEIWTDGACSNNGRPNAKAAWAFVSGDYEDGGLVDGKQTNNRGEALAIYHALFWAASKGYKQIRIHTDSQITLHGVIKHPEKVKENRDIFQKIHDVVTKNNLEIKYQKVLGHSDNVNNNRADQLAVKLSLE